MTIDLKDHDKRGRLKSAIKLSWERGACERNQRADLISIYADKPRMVDMLLEDDTRTAYLHLFSDFIRGNEINLAYRAPRWAVNARTVEGKGFDKKAGSFLEAYAGLLSFDMLLERWAKDAAFGRAVAKTITSIAPKGVYSMTAPRCFRLNPDNYIPDRSAPSNEECSYKCDIYFADLDDAKKHEHFNAAKRAKLQPWTNNARDSSSLMNDTGDYHLFASDQTRLIDVYIPALGIIATWPCNSDAFSEIADDEPLMVMPALTDPYTVLEFLTVPDSLEIISRLGQLRQLNMLANDNYTKAARQAANSQRNPVADLGDEMDANSLLGKADGEIAFMANSKAVDIFNIPGPDPSILEMAASAEQHFSNAAGNLQVAMGVSPGANTARQTQALIGQITQAQQVDRMKFERFISEIGKKILTWAFFDETLQINYAVRGMGNSYPRNETWGPPALMPRVGEIDDYAVEVVACSTAFRGPSERLQQLIQASGVVSSFMAQKAQGFPINLEAVMEDVAQSFDLVPNLVEWWTGQDPTPQEKTGQTYTSMAGNQPAQGSNVNYNGVGNSGSAGGESSYAASPGGLASAGGVV